MSKASPRMAAIGDVDEANCAVGAAAALLDEGELKAALGRIQNEMFDLGADLATPLPADGRDEDWVLRMVAAQSERLEAEIDRFNAALEPLTSFILPGGTSAVAALHLARAVTRRAERAAVALAAEEAVNPQALTYLNRLSDHLFVAARHLAAQSGGDLLWKPGATR